MLKLNNSIGGSVIISANEDLISNDTAVFESMTLNSGISVTTLNGLEADEYLHTDINTSTTGIITQTERPIFNGQLGGYAYARANYVASLSTHSNTGFIIENDRIYPQHQGTYYFQAGQLIRTTSVTAYMYLRKNGTNIVWGYSNSDSNYDIKCNAIIEMEVGDYLDIYYSGTTSYSWSGEHSNVECFLI